MQLETCERVDKTETFDLIDLNSPTNFVHTSGTTRNTGSKESDVASSFSKEMDGFQKSTVTSQNQDKFQKLNLGRSSSNQSNMSCETVKMMDIHGNSNLPPTENTEYNRELQKMVSFVDEEKYSDRSSASPGNFKDKKETDGESSELSFECPSMEKFQMMEDHSFVQSSIIDQDMERVEGLLEGWTSDLKKKILAEFSQSKIRLLEYYRQQIALVKEKHDKEISQVKMENGSFRELVKGFEQSLEQKDETISLLKSRVESYQNKLQLQKYFSDWKIKHSKAAREVGSGCHDRNNWGSSVFNFYCLDSKTDPIYSYQYSLPYIIIFIIIDYIHNIVSIMSDFLPAVFATQIVMSPTYYKQKLNASFATRHYNQCLMRKVVNTWHSMVESRILREKSSQVETEGVIEGLRREYEDKLTVMNQSLEQSRKEIERLNHLKVVTNETTKKTLPIGVCSLDLETLFQERRHEANEKLSKSDGARNIYVGHYHDSASCLTTRQSSHYSPQMLHHEEPTYFSDPNPPARRTATIHRKPTTLHFPTKIKTNKPKQIKVIPSKKTNQNITGSLLGNSLAPPMTSVVVERHHPINKETIGQALACRFPVSVIKMKATPSLKNKSGRSNGQLIRVLN